jgi:SAM-dependent methyltransferase
MKNKFKIKGPIFIGRSYEEYLKFFHLNEECLKNKKVLDCAAGASSFTPHMNQKGYDTVAVDILYHQDPDFLQKRCENHLNALVEALSQLEGHFVWSFFQNLDQLREHRMKVCRDFSQDYPAGKGKKYIKASLISLPFKDNTFDLVLCSHLLFIYDHRLSYDFHLNSIKEMLRVASGELRIYPLVKSKGEKSPFLERIIKELQGTVEIEIVKVDYEFRKGGDEMMRMKPI